MSKGLKEIIWEVSRELPVFQKESQGFKFKYINLEQIVKKLDVLLKERGVAYRHSTFVLDGHNVLQTTVFFLADPKVIQTVELIMPNGVTLPGMNPYQSLGSAITYFRRYNLVTIFDILGTDEDADATNVTKKTAKIDYVKRLQHFIASGKHEKIKLEGWFNKNRGTMDDSQRAECLALITNMK